MIALQYTTKKIIKREILRHFKIAEKTRGRMLGSCEEHVDGGEISSVWLKLCFYWLAQDLFQSLLSVRESFKAIDNSSLLFRELQYISRAVFLTTASLV